MTRRKIQRILHGVEHIGIMVLLLVVIAVRNVTLPAEIIISHASIVIYALEILVLLSLVMGTLHVSKRLSFLREFRPYFGVVILLAGGSIFWCYPEYFHLLKANPPSGFWYLVSTYSLPAILVEGGLFTLFTEFLERNNRVTDREFAWLSAGFVLYAITSVSANFCVLSNIITPDQQIFLARIVVLIALAIGGYVWWAHHRPRKN